VQQANGRSRRLRFGVFEVDVRTGELTRQGRRVRLQEQPFRLLVMLLERPGDLVTRDELRGQLWPQTTVDFDHGLNKAVSKLRDALGDSAENPRFIETVARRGYRFLADVTVIGGVESGEPSAPVGAATGGPEIPRTKPREEGHDDDEKAEPVSRSRRRIAIWTVLGIAVALGLAMGARVWSSGLWRPSAPEIRALAVLPLENLSNDPSQDYFADGMTEELITDLGQIGALRVISRTSAMTYKGAHKPLPEIARELNVDAVVEGSVMRSGDQVRITAQLIEGPADTHIWARSYEGDLRDTLGLQSRVARDIAQQIRVALNRREQDALGTSRVVNPEAFEAYLKGRFFWNKRSADGLKTAIEFFDDAIKTDPGYAEAWAGLADSYALAGDLKYGVLPRQEAFSKATMAANRALALDEGLGEAHASLAFAYDLYGWKWDAAEREYRRALELNPGYATAHQWYAWHLNMMGRTGEAMQELRQAERLDPLSLIISADIAEAFLVTRRFDDAEEQSRKTLRMDPNFAVSHYELGQALLQRQSYDEAIAEFRAALALSRYSSAFASGLAFAYAVTGRREDAVSIARELQVRSEEEPSVGADIALIYVGLGQPDDAIGWLNTAFAARFKASVLLRPGFDALRPDPQYKDIVRRIGAPGLG
jgi:TolB-like protein/DNA-binding winged helix-turn-helix (wHTH) protein/Tfp pilus assembly protein PilF